MGLPHSVLMSSRLGSTSTDAAVAARENVRVTQSTWPRYKLSDVVRELGAAPGTTC